MRYAVTWAVAAIRSVTTITPTVRQIEIVPAGGVQTFNAGAHIDVTVMVDGLPQTRSYSLVGTSGSDHYRIAVKLKSDSKGGSAYMWTLEPGARLEITNPKSSFELDFGHSEYLLIAGGIGITPLVGMAMVLKRRGARFRLLYAARTADELAFASELRTEIGDQLETFVAQDGQMIDLAQVFSLLPQGALCAMCGPMPMLDDARRLWNAAAHPASNLRWETFGSSGSHASVEFKVIIPRLSREITVPRTRSLLDVLDEAGVGVIFDCRKGECGLCAMPILSVDGEVDHRDVFFSDEQKKDNHMLCACVSRATGTLVIDTAYRPDTI
jgi:dimethylamine monooxygenase subunit B